MAEVALPKGYEPAAVEEQWISFWENARCFSPEADGPGEPYSIVIPPPNVTGALHMGHALNITIQDILCRFHRQLGRKVLWIPGTDHAGIATQNVVERQLKKEGKTRHDLGREQFIKRVWDWRQEYGGRILNQIRRMGASVDWTRERFTMDQGLSRSVREVFVRLYHEGLIYKGDYIINWCNRCHTALADDEVEHSPKQGKIYEIKYPLQKGDGHLVVATTRPETMLGDTAVAVHPEDERYNQLIGEYVVLPLVNRRLPIIGDNYVDREFGTGCLKVTPAHDMNDWDLGRKHNLEILQVIDENGRMNDNAPEQYRGLSKDECRERVVQDLEAEGLLSAIRDHEHNVGECYRCKGIIEPHVSTQWFVKVKPLAEKARAAVPSQTKIYPAQWEKVYHDWLDNIRDWCISRQIWWGHRIPAWTCQKCGYLIVAASDPTECPICKDTRLVQEEDVLDTWFSSALWPFSTMGWPGETKEVKTFYPTAVLVTGFDILFFWVARMMMMGIHFMEQVPFRDVYIHALVRDAQGKKMSKSTGNVIDPVLMIDKYGTDAFRFTLAAFAAMGRDIRMAEERIEGYRHFINKLWNASRFALMHLSPEVPDQPQGPVKSLSNQWMLHRLEEVKAEVAKALHEYRFNDAAQTLYHFLWYEFCDWYLEMSKIDLNGQDEAAKSETRICLKTTLSEILILLHPMIPFVTQEIWSHVHPGEKSNLTLVPYPSARPQYLNAQVVDLVRFLQDTVVSVRNIRSELGVAPGKELNLLIRADGVDRGFLLGNKALLQSLAKVGNITVEGDITPPKASATAVVKGHEVFVPLEGVVDFTTELARLDKELAKTAKDLEVVNRKLSNEDFVAKAPEDVVAKERQKIELLNEKHDKMAALKERLAGFLAEG